MAAAVALSPIPIVAIVLILDSRRARVNGLAFAGAWVLGLAVVSVAVVLLADGASDPDSDVATGVNWLLVAIGSALVVMAGRQWKKRPKHGEEPEMPAWLAGIDSISPAKAAGLGAALAAINPKNLALTVAASTSIARAGLDGIDLAIAVTTFVLLGSVTVLGAVVFYLVAPATAQRPLASIRAFMAQNNATIMMVILLILGLKVIGDGVGAF
jgi:hypothetical protein